jgi:hypothetical protein
MATQETALYSDLVLYLRDQATQMLVAAGAYASLEEAKQQLDVLIHDWLFTPQEDLYGSAPREIIWREQLNQGNPLPPEFVRQAMADSQSFSQTLMEKLNSSNSEEFGYQEGWFWQYTPDQTLIDIYDPEGSEDRWAQEQIFHQPQLDPTEVDEPIPNYEPPAVDDFAFSPDEFLEKLNWVSQQAERLQPIVEHLIERFEMPTLQGITLTEYRRLTERECLILLTSLEVHGVDLDELSKHVMAWPYQNISLDWFSNPEKQLFDCIYAMETRTDPANKAELIRFRQHRDLLFVLCRLIPHDARLWIQGWLHGLALNSDPEE